MILIAYIKKKDILWLLSLDIQVAHMSWFFNKVGAGRCKKWCGEAHSKLSSDRVRKICLKVGNEMAYAEDEVLSWIN